MRCRTNEIKHPFGCNRHWMFPEDLLSPPSPLFYMLLVFSGPPVLRLSGWISVVFELRLITSLM